LCLFKLQKDSLSKVLSLLKALSQRQAPSTLSRHLIKAFADLQISKRIQVDSSEAKAEFQANWVHLEPEALGVLSAVYSIEIPKQQ